MSAFQKINYNGLKEILRDFVELVLFLVTRLIRLVLISILDIMKWMIEPPNVRFITNVSDASSPTTESINSCQNPVLVTETVQWVIDRVLDTMWRVTDCSWFKCMIVMSRCPKGGKTTILKNIYAQLRIKKINVMFVSFDAATGFRHVLGETACEGLFRAMTNQLNPNMNETAPRLVDWDALDRHIGDKPFVLLIDDINGLCPVIDFELSRILREYFLDKANRHTAMTCPHPFMSKGFWSGDEIVRFNERPVTMVPMPICYDKHKLVDMDPLKCATITRSKASYYGGIPSLMYSVLAHEESPLIRFTDKFPEPSSNVNEFHDFVLALHNGMLMPSLKHYYCFASDVLAVKSRGVIMRWPMCYIACILRRYRFSSAAAEIVKCIEVLECDGDTVSDEMVWEQFIRISILLRFVLASSAVMRFGAFDLCGQNDARGSAIQVITLGIDVRSVDQARTKIEHYAANFQLNTQVLFVPATEGKLEQFDGYCVRYCAGKVCDVSAFQWRGRGGWRDDTTVPKWINRGGHRLRSSNSGVELTHWRYYNDRDTDAFLGWSLQLLSTRK